MAGAMTTVRYISDTTKAYAIKMAQADATAVGCTGLTGGELNAPKGLKPRKVHLRDYVENIGRSLVCCDRTNDLFTGTAQSVQLTDYTSLTAKTFAAIGRTGESCRGSNSC